MSEHWKELPNRAKNEKKTSYELLAEIDKKNETKNLDKESSKPSNPISYSNSNSKSGRKSPQHKAFSKPPRYLRRSPPPPALTMEQLEITNT